MPSDVVWVALISSAAPLVVGIAAVIVQKSSTKIQLDSGREELRLQLQAQAEENLRSRLGELRKTYLVPLSEKLSEWLVESRIVVGALAAAQTSLASGHQLAPNVANGIKDAFEAAGRTAGAFNALQDRISDPQLYSLVQDAIGRGNTEAAIPLIALMSSPQPSIESASRALDEFQRAQRVLQQSLIAINRRIEELVAGYPTSDIVLHELSLKRTGEESRVSGGSPGVH